YSQVVPAFCAPTQKKSGSGLPANVCSGIDSLANASGRRAVTEKAFNSGHETCTPALCRLCGFRAREFLRMGAPRPAHAAPLLTASRYASGTRRLKPEQNWFAPGNNGDLL